MTERASLAKASLAVGIDEGTNAREGFVAIDELRFPSLELLDP